MTASSPVTARGTPPDTGASTIRTPSGCRPAASSSVSDGSDELISTSSAPSRRAAPIPQPSIASRTIAPLGSIVTTRPAGANASGEAAATAPGCSAANWSCFAASMSRTTSRKPAACRFLAIGQPMLPRPTKPTVTCCSGTLIAIAAAFLLLLVFRLDCDRRAARLTRFSRGTTRSAGRTPPGPGTGRRGRHRGRQ